MMKKIRELITSPKGTIVLFVLAAGLLLFSTIGAARAAFLAVSENYTGKIEMYNIGVTLLEKCQNDDKPRAVASRDHIKNSADKWTGDEVGELVNAESFLGKDAAIVPGKDYPEEISVSNTGTIDEYVRVTIYKYWTDPEGNKVFVSADADTDERGLKGITTQGLSPALIRLNLINSDVWLKDEKASTEERLVLYYKNVLKAGEDTSAKPICDTLTIDSAVEDKVSQEVSTDDEGYTSITTVYDYDGWRFCLEAQVDAVQSHNIVDAAKSAWGVNLQVSDSGQISLAN